jgi:hypothetical protein
MINLTSVASVASVALCTANIAFGQYCSLEKIPLQEGGGCTEKQSISVIFDTILTPWSRVCLENQIVKNFMFFKENKYAVHYCVHMISALVFILIHFTFSKPICLRSILI